MEAFERAKTLGADGIETDVRMTKDNELILFHDHSIGKKATRQLTLKQMKSRLGYKPTVLNDLLNWADNDFILNLEIKEHDIVAAVYEELKRFTRKNIVISSFHHPASFKLAKAAKAKCALLMPVRPVYIKPFLQLIPADLEYIVWDYGIYDIEFKVQLLNFKHLVYGMGELRPKKKDFVDGIISDHLDIHIRRRWM
jgi:glycerophosphoryl diester phosphodiesterase